MPFTKIGHVLLLAFSLGIFVLAENKLNAQTNTDYFGAGQNVGVSISSSGNQANSEAANTFSGTELIPDYAGAARFLAQAQLGYSEVDIQNVINIGIDEWIDQEIAKPYTPYYQKLTDIYLEIISNMEAIYGVGNANYDRKNAYISLAFYDKALTENDNLRQKIAFALSQIFVISYNGGINNFAHAYINYYDILYHGAFGNYRDLLYNITMNPAMGTYLSHMKNQKADPVEGTLPDENFAREIMQLFSIGLFELNNDGSLKLDANGETIPTYNIEDVQEMAKVFTGLSGGGFDTTFYPQTVGQTLNFGSNSNLFDYSIPMIMYDNKHETSAKTLPDGTVIPANQTGMEDINDAIDWLYNHPNVGPFIGTRLIQQLVKSNPTPAYINRVASAFNNDGNGVRGNMETVVRAVLTDPEARDCNFITDSRNGKMLQPLERILQLYKAFDISTPSGKYWFSDNATVYNYIEQAFLFAPSVFNFFSPFYAEGEYVAPNNMVSPEFQVLHSTSGIYYINLIETGLKVAPNVNLTAIGANQPSITQNNSDLPTLDFSDEINIYNTQGLSALINHVDLLLCRGELQAITKAIIEDNINQNLANNTPNFSVETIVHDVIYYTMMSPNYVILK